MTDTPFLDHRAIRKLADQCPKLGAILAQREIFDAIDPITPALVGEDAPHQAMGYFATEDGRILFRLVCQQEAQEVFGVDACSVEEAFLVADRISHIGEIERAGMDAQARAVKLMRYAEMMFAAISGGPEIGKKDRIRIGALLHEVRTEDAARAEEIEAMRETQAQANRDRKWALRKMGYGV